MNSILKHIFRLFIIFTSFQLHATINIVTTPSNNGAGSIQQVIDSSNNGDTVRFDPALIATGSRIISISNTIILEKDITIIGLYNSQDTLFISGNNNRALFQIRQFSSPHSKITFDSLVLINGNNNWGASALNLGNHFDTVNIRNCIISGNMSTSSYPAVRVTGIELNISNTLFSNNKTNNLGAALHSRCNTTNISQSTFINNVSQGVIINNTGNGGAIYIGGDSLHITSTVFENNIASNKGGAIFINDPDSINIEIFKTSFFNNHCGARGGAIYVNGNAFYNILIDSSIYNSNTANIEGGAIFLNIIGNTPRNVTSTNYEFNIKNSLFEKNVCYQSQIGIGGAAIFISEINSTYNKTEVTINLINNIIKSNRSNANVNFNGGALVFQNIMNCTININKCILSSNTSFSSAPIYIDNLQIPALPTYFPIINISNTCISNNSSTLPAGAIEYVGNINELNLNNTIIKDNELGIGIDLWGSNTYNHKINVYNSKIINNGLHGIHTRTKCSLLINNSLISKHHSLTDGGGIYSLGKTTLMNSTIEKNSCLRNGGGIYSEDSVIIINSTLNDNIAGDTSNLAFNPGYGAAIYSYSLTLKNSTISNNISTRTGSAFFVRFGNIYIDNSTIINNKSFNGVTITSSPFVYTKSSILAMNIENYSSTSNTHPTLITSQGNNLFDIPYHFSLSTDSLNVTSTDLNLGVLKYNGGLTKTIMPIAPSLAINAGDSLDFADAQNRPIIGRRDIGAAESNCQVIFSDTIYSCGCYIFREDTLCKSGIYNKAVTPTNGCDSIFNLNLIIDKKGTIKDSSCSPYSWYGKTYDSSGVYYQTLSNLSTCNSTDTLTFIRLQSTNSNLIVNHCGNGYYRSLSGQDYYNDAIFHDTITNSLGCDSIIEIDLRFVTQNNTISSNGSTLSANFNNSNYQWYNCNTNSIITNETNQTFSPISNGSYAVILTTSSCQDTSSCFNVNNVSIDNINHKNIISNVYPNPNNGAFVIDFNEIINEEILIYVYNIGGQLVYKKSLFLNKKEIKITSLNYGGVYLLKIEGEKINEQHLIMVND